MGSGFEETSCERDQLRGFSEKMNPADAFGLALGAKPRGARTIRFMTRCVIKICVEHEGIELLDDARREKASAHGRVIACGECGNKGENVL